MQRNSALGSATQHNVERNFNVLHITETVISLRREKKENQKDISVTDAATFETVQPTETIIPDLNAW